MQDGGISEETFFKILSAAWRRGAEKAYSSAWGKWILWCNKQESNPFPSSIGPVVNFLTEEFKHGKQHTTVNSYRSVLSTTHPPIDGKPVGQHPVVCWLLQGKKGPPASQLSLKELSKRLVTLLALCNASRASDIKALESRFKVFTDGGVKFTIPGLTKTHRSGPPKEVFFVEFKEGECLCPVRTVKVYLDKTDPLRDSNSQLVISHRKPHSPVSSATISPAG